MKPSTPGRYRYMDPIGGQPQEVHVLDVGGELAVRFADMDEDDGEDVLVSDLAGDFEPA
ncbi:MAG TPA: hypothetical protein VIL30_15505 [Ramlibacter sp.]|jgi:hypothetical protein